MNTRYQVFATLAAAALLFRWEPAIFFLTDRRQNVTWSGWPPVLFAFAVLLRPGDLRPLLAMYAAIAVDVLVIAPACPNHYLLTVFVGLTVLATAASGARRLGRLPTGEALLTDLAGPARVGVAAFYLFTGVWKSNDGFLDPRTSCGALSWARLVGQFPFLPDGDGVRSAVIGFTLALEHLGPLLLLLPAVRAPVACFFLFFHAVLSLDVEQNYQNFSWAMAPLLALFLPEDAWERASARFARWPELFRYARWNLLFGHALLLGVAAASSVVVATWHFEPHWTARWLVATLCFWTLPVGAAAVAWIGRGSTASSPGRAAGWLLLGLVLLNGLSPVIGFKNRNAWQMYSNVRIEASASNHWYLPPSLDLFGLQRDVVHVLDASDERLLRETRDQGLGLTWFDFRVYLADHPATQVRYERGGITYLISSPDERPDPPPWLVRKLVWFRPVGEAVERQCQW